MTITVSQINNYETQINNNVTGAIYNYYNYLGGEGIAYGDLAKQVGETGFYGDIAEDYFYDKVEELHPNLTPAEIDQKKGCKISLPH